MVYLSSAFADITQCNEPGWTLLHLDNLNTDRCMSPQQKMVRVGYTMLIALPYHAIHTQKASSLALEEHLLQQKCPMQHLQGGSLSAGNGDALLLLGEAACCSQTTHAYFICLPCSMGMGCSWKTEKEKA